MAAKSRQTHVKRARELALKEKRERKQAKKEARIAERQAILDGTYVPPTEGEAEGASEVDATADAETEAEARD